MAGDSSGYDTDRSYKFKYEENSRPKIVVRKIDMFMVIRVQSLIRGWLARRRGKKYPMILYNRILN